MICEKCGIELPDDSMYCAGCGAMQADALLNKIASGGGYGRKRAGGIFSLWMNKWSAKAPLNGFSDPASAAPPEKKKKKSSCSCFSTLIVVVIFLGIVAMGIPGFVAERNRKLHVDTEIEAPAAINKIKYEECLAALNLVKNAEEIYFKSRAEYTDNLNLLATHAVSGCDDPEGLAEGCMKDGVPALESLLNESCPGGHVASVVKDEFYLRGIIEECSICVSSFDTTPLTENDCDNSLQIQDKCSPFDAK